MRQCTPKGMAPKADTILGAIPWEVAAALHSQSLIS